MFKKLFLILVIRSPGDPEDEQNSN